jgi:hypothetical protein
MGEDSSNNVREKEFRPPKYPKNRKRRELRVVSAQFLYIDVVIRRRRGAEKKKFEMIDVRIRVHVSGDQFIVLSRFSSNNARNANERKMT